MTEHVQSFMREMAEAYRALEQEDGYKDRIASLEEQHLTDGDRIARLEQKLIDMKRAEDDLTSKLAEVCRERDDAGFRLLEAEDKLDGIKRSLGFQDAIATAVAKAEANVRTELTPKPQVEPELTIVPETTPEQVSSWGTPWATSEEPTQSPTVETGPSSEPVIASTGDVASQPSAYTGDGPVSGGTQGESATDPTAGGTGTGTESTSTGDSGPESHGPFHGKRYVDIPDFVRLDDWLAGGGTEADYYWRPASIRPAAAS